MGRNIILLSDGTGASSLSASKSNVWRVFTTLDLGPGSDQIAFYDDGVGTSGIKWLRVLGGGFGWGLSRNVRQMYAFLCRHYQPGDRIYIFGFSRGAFTARVLAHLIGVCGILDRSKDAPGKSGRRMETDRGFRLGVKQAYKSYRRRYWDQAWVFQRKLAETFRSIRNLLPRWRVLPVEEFKARYSLPPPANGDRLIEFVGVWDTVDAVGLPVDELSDLLDEFIYPYKFPNQAFSDHVERACHALAIDDERETFHPVLWDESDPAKAARVKQVWFAGMHSNVGGGYPEDNLGFLSLDWMLTEACVSRPGVPALKFNAQKLEIFKNRGEPVGKLYDSRRGAASYYRYKPRYIADLCSQHLKVGKDARRRIHVSEPKIHHSVFARIADSKAGYAPIGLPPRFSVVDAIGNVAPFSDPAFDNEGAPNGPLSPARQRETLLERTRDHVFWRIFIYFFLLILTFSVVSMPFFRPPIPGWVPEGGLAGWISELLATAFDRLAGVIPDFANYWTDTLVQSPYFAVSFVLLFVSVFLWSYRVEGNLRELSEGALWHIKGNTAPRWVRPPGVPTNVSRAIRTSALAGRIGWLFSHFLVPFVFALLSLYVILCGGYRLFVHYPAVKDGVCTMALAGARSVAATKSPSGSKVSTTGEGQPEEKVFETSDPCFDTGIKLVEGRHYKVTLGGNEEWNKFLGTSRLFNDPFCLRNSGMSFWQDDGRPATFKGFNCLLTRYHPVYLGGLPTRRLVFVPWFTLVGEIGGSGVTIPFNRTTFQFKAPADGRLYLYVNDAIDSMHLFEETCAPGEAKCACVDDWRCYYTNNKGSAVVTYRPFGMPEPTTDPAKPRIAIEEMSNGD